MRTLYRLIDKIDTYKKNVRKQECKILKTINSETQARIAAVVAIEGARSYSTLQSVAVSIGREIMRPYENENAPEEQTAITRFKIGSDLLMILFDLNVLNYRRDKDRDMYKIVIKDNALVDELWEDVRIPETEEESVSTRPQFNRPKDWTKPFHPVFGVIARNTNPNIKNNLNKGNIPVVYDCINKLQRTPLTVDNDLLNVFIYSLQDEVFRMAEMSLDDTQRTSIYRDNAGVLELAMELADKKFYTGYFLDFRGRVYPTMSKLNLVGSKLSKSLIRTWEKKKIGTAGISWLKLHIANCCGHDKLPVDDRIKWTEDNWNKLVAIADNPIDNKEWQTLEDPFNALAGIMELNKCLKHRIPSEYKTSILVAFDATNSGAQILSTVVRDEDGMRLSNLIENDDIQDLYMEVADMVWEQFEDDDYWKDKYVYRRKLCKRPVMTKFYSCGVRTAAKAIVNDFKPNPVFKDITFKDAMRLSGMIDRACRKILPGVMKVMDKFVEIADLANQSEEDFGIVNPINGFPVTQYYREHVTKRVKLRYNKVAINVNLIVGKNKELDKTKALTGASPNVTHSLDAAIVHFLISSTKYDVLTIHDSFMTSPCDAGQLFEDVRGTFVDIFSDNVLDKILSQYGANMETGDLTLEGVLDNEYCFS